MKKAFTLVEVLIVAAILGILAAVVIPELGNHVQLARESAAKDTLRVVREAIERFYSNYNVSPGYASQDPSEPAGSVYFLMDIIAKSEYLQNIPENPFNEKTTLNVIQNGDDMPESATGDFGWIYKPETRTIRLDWPGTDSKGQNYYEY